MYAQGGQCPFSMLIYPMGLSEASVYLWQIIEAFSENQRVYNLIQIPVLCTAIQNVTVFDASMYSYIYFSHNKTMAIYCCLSHSDWCKGGGVKIGSISLNLCSE